MTPSPICKVLSILHTCGVRFLLMGGQACVLYGAAEFSRDTDIAILAETSNLKRLSRALALLHAENIAVPALSLKWLRKGHAVHFRCHHPDAENMRLDIMAKMRNAASFKQLWRRRTTVVVAAGESYELVSLPDLVQIKKTQRDKDWLMLRRLVEAHYFSHSHKPDPKKIYFWLTEMRNPDILVRLAKKYPGHISRLAGRRPALRHALHGDKSDLDIALRKEEEMDRAADRRYWEPLKKDLERLRHQVAHS